jgi:hypothetical protein
VTKFLLPYFRGYVLARAIYELARAGRIFPPFSLIKLGSLEMAESNIPLRARKMVL